MSAGRIELTPLEVERDLRTVHDWMRRPHARPWWDLAKPLGHVRSYLELQVANDHVTPWLARLDEVPFAYVETYRAVDDPIAMHYPARADDRGWHVMVGPERLLGSGIPRRMGRVVLEHMFDVEGARRVVCEPDERNLRMIAFCERLGGRVAGRLELPDKRAVLIVWDGRP